MPAAPTARPLAMSRARIPQLLAGFAGVAALLVVLAGTAGAQDAYPPTFTVATPGATITITGSSFPPVEVEVTYVNAEGAAVSRAATTADESGSFAAELDIPADAQEGEGTVVVRSTDDNGETQQAARRVLVQADDAGGSAGGGSGDGTGSGDATVEVSPADTTTTGGSEVSGSDDGQVSSAGLARTGEPTSAWLVAAAALLAVGAGSVVAARVIDARSREGARS